MTVQLFGVTSAMVRADYFSQLNDFSTDSNPSSTSVDRYIQQKAARLEAELLQESIDTNAVNALGAATAPYLWCQETLSLMVAIRIAEDMTQARPPLADAWEKRLETRLDDLDVNGYLALGSGLAAPTIPSDGPTHFIDTLSLSTADNTRNASTITTPFHKDDLL